MLYYNRIDVYEGIDVTKTGAKKLLFVIFNIFRQGFMF